MNIQVFPQFINICLYIFLLKILNAHTPHTHTDTYSYMHTPHTHTSIYCGTHCMLSLFVVTLLHATFVPHSFYLLIRLRLELSLSTAAPHMSLSLYFSLSLRPPPPPVQRELMFYYVHKFSWVLIFLKFFKNYIYII